MGSARDGIYLSGWEYNRLLQKDPIAIRNTALPAEILWNGSAPLWMFRNVFCTQEAIDNELCAYDTLGWPSGLFFTELCSLGIMQPLDWKRDLGSATQRLVEEKHKELLTSVVTAGQVRELISAGATGELDVLKNALLAPIADSKNCVLSVTPNSLRHWIAPKGPHAPSATETVLSEIASRVPSGLTLCSAPGTGVSDDALRAQRQVEIEHQAPRIPELLAGDGRFSGPTGYQAYLTELKPFRSAFGPINDQLLDDWQRNRDNLIRLREAAEKHLWPFLHGEWIPALESGEASAEEFVNQLNRALQQRKIAGFLGQRGRIAVVVSATAAGGIATALQAIATTHLAALPSSVSAGIAAGIAAGAAATVTTISEDAAKRRHQSDHVTNQLTMFYQEAERLTQLTR